MCLKKASTSSTKIISGLRESDMLKTTFQLLKERVRLLLSYRPKIVSTINEEDVNDQAAELQVIVMLLMRIC